MRKFSRLVRAAAVSVVAAGVITLVGAAPAHADRTIYPPTVGTAYAWVPESGSAWTDRKCMEVYGWNKYNGAQVGQWSCRWGANQQWRLGYTQQSNVYYIQNVDSGKCLDVYNWSTNYGDPVVQWDCLLGANQQWQLIWDYYNGRAQFRNVNSGLCLSVDGLSTDNGRRMVQNVCYGFTNQVFEPILPAS
jgi:hypothetical protein